MPKCRVELLTPAWLDIDSDYVCIYKVVGDIIYIHRIVHGATDYPKLFK